MKILPHPAPRQIPSNFRQILAARRAPPSNSVKFRRLAGPRQIPSNSGPRSGPYYPAPWRPAAALYIYGFCLYRTLEKYVRLAVSTGAVPGTVTANASS